MPKNRRDQPIVLSHIYTRTGDDGTTALGDMSRVPKTDPRLVAYADVDEANCAIGTALALAGFGDDVTAVLTRVQNELFDVGADLCNPVSDNPPYPPLRIDDSYVSALEHDCDEQNADLPVRRELHPARRHARGGAAAHRQDRRAPGRAQRLGRPGRPR